MKYLNRFIDFYQTQDSIIFWSTSFSTLMALLMLSIWLIFITKLPPQIPLFYSLPWGETQLAQTPQFILLPSITILIMLINLILSWHLHPSQIVVKRVLSLSSAITSFIILLSALKIIFTFV